MKVLFLAAALLAHMPHLTVTAPCATQAVSAASPASVTLSTCGRSGFVMNKGAAPINVKTGGSSVGAASKADYIIAPGAGRNFRFKPTDTTLSIFAATGNVTASVEQCAALMRPFKRPTTFCKWTIK